ncbi:ROK family transcriptional regulator [Cellulomonas sp. B6]|jgi:predicted NBD/HSP70 family sugar kinase|uniref:ROK family transcriptional regulator n=1 Tax=Cellulomonas sp. B6 TaxID=1295626 RepID=UPI00073BF9B5|nr:ROK family transcriptional regulator [Cellulomonas sp. B6]KSW29895.1 transcriptional regulator [Cellulomonas sp. B6]
MSGSQSSLRGANRALVVETVKRYGGLTQVELTAATGLSPATVSSIVKELLAAGAVDTHSTIRSGRRAQLVTIARQTGLAAGVDVGPRHLRVALGDVTREIVAEQTLPLPADHRADTTLDRVALLVIDLLERVGATIDELVGLGVGLPAPVEPGTGLVTVRGLLRGWDEVPVVHVLSKRLAKPVLVDNNANLGALAESRFGAARGYQDAVYVAAGAGTGAGIILSGHLHRGFGGTAGEIGHVQVDPQGRICRCGSRGCLDTVVGYPALVEPLTVSHGTLTLRDLVQHAVDGDPGCRQVVADAGAVIGGVVAGMAMVVNPQCVVIGGELAETGDLLVQPMREAISRRVPLNQMVTLDVVPGDLGVRAKVLGALALVLEATDQAGADGAGPGVGVDVREG